MKEQNQGNKKNLQSKSEARGTGSELDAAGKSLSDALRISFIILKVIMIVLIVVFLASGFRTVGPYEEALVLRFGKIKPVGEERVLGPGPHWVFPYPIEQIVKIPVQRMINVAIDSFWYFQRPEEMLPAGPKTRIRIGLTLDPLRDGYCITRSEKLSWTAGGSAGSDYNIVHCKWELTYQIENPEQFFRNVYVEDVKPGQTYFDVITESVTPLLKSLFEDAVVTTMVNFTIDDAIRSRPKIPDDVKKLFQEKLDKIDSGIKAVSVQLTYPTWPRQVDPAFQGFISASQKSQTKIGEARTYAEEALNEAAGPVAEELLAVLKGKTVSEQEEKLLWEDQVAGSAGKEIAEAKAYRTEVVETAKARAEYLQEILPEYHKYPDLVVQRIYLDAMETILNDAAEKFVYQSSKGTKGTEVRVLVNRNPTIKRK